jgi:hypothetical protein
VKLVRFSATMLFTTTCLLLVISQPASAGPSAWPDLTCATFPESLNRDGYELACMSEAHGYLSDLAPRSASLPNGDEDVPVETSEEHADPESLENHAKVDDNSDVGASAPERPMKLPSTGSGSGYGSNLSDTAPLAFNLLMAIAAAVLALAIASSLRGSRR